MLGMKLPHFPTNVRNLIGFGCTPQQTWLISTHFFQRGSLKSAKPSLKTGLYGWLALFRGSIKFSK